MDRISKAIELANKKRTNQGATGQSLAGVDLSQIARLEVSPEVLESNKLVAGILSNPVSEYYRVLRTKMLKVMEQNNWKVIGVTGPTTGSGKSLTSANLSIAMAMEPNTTALLVDADLRKPAQSRLFQVQPDLGIAEFVTGKKTLAQSIYSVGIEGHAVLFNARQQFGSSDVLTSRTVKGLIEQFRQSDDGGVAIFDLPPVFVGDDAIAVASMVDAVLMVVDSGHTTKSQLQSALELLKDANIAGCVLNNAPDSDCIAQQYSYY